MRKQINHASNLLILWKFENTNCLEFQRLGLKHLTQLQSAHKRELCTASRCSGFLIKQRIAKNTTQTPSNQRAWALKVIYCLILKFSFSLPDRFKKNVCFHFIKLNPYITSFSHYLLDYSYQMKIWCLCLG